MEVVEVFEPSQLVENNRAVLLVSFHRSERTNPFNGVDRRFRHLSEQKK